MAESQLINLDTMQMGNYIFTIFVLLLSEDSHDLNLPKEVKAHWLSYDQMKLIMKYGRRKDKIVLRRIVEWREAEERWRKELEQWHECWREAEERWRKVEEYVTSAGPKEEWKICSESRGEDAESFSSCAVPPKSKVDTENNTKQAASTVDAQFRAAAPKGVEAGEQFPLMITMYAPDYKQDAIEALETVADKRTETISGIHEVAIGSRVKIRLFSDDIPIEDDVNEQNWNGKLCVFSFILDLPESYAKNNVVIKSRVYVDDAAITEMKLLIKVQKGYQYLDVDIRRILSAFASYSSKDRAIVAARIQGMQAATGDKMDIFFDVESLHEGEDWERRINEEISKRSIFYLFWSRNARDSEWVRRELDIALRIKDPADIEPVPLETPDVCPPPVELISKHFSVACLTIPRNRIQMRR